MGLESQVIGEISDRQFYAGCIGVPCCEYLLPFVVDSGLEGMYFALDGFLYCEDLMVLFNPKARDNSSEVDHTYGSII